MTRAVLFDGITALGFDYCIFFNQPERLLALILSVGQIQGILRQIIFG